MCPDARAAHGGPELIDEGQERWVLVFALHGVGYLTGDIGDVLVVWPSRRRIVFIEGADPLVDGIGQILDAIPRFGVGERSKAQK